MEPSCWDAFGSDSDDSDAPDNSDDSDAPDNSDRSDAPDDESGQEAIGTIGANGFQRLESAFDNSFDSAFDAITLSITRHFVTSTKSCGVSLKERVVAIGAIGAVGRGGSNAGAGTIGSIQSMEGKIANRISGRGMIVASDASDDLCECDWCDAAILLVPLPKQGEVDDALGASSKQSKIRRGLVPGGFLWLLIIDTSTTVTTSTARGEENDTQTNTDDAKSNLRNILDSYSEAIWDVNSATVVHDSTDTSVVHGLHLQVIRIQKRECVVNAWSCPWMDKHSVIWKTNQSNGEGEGDGDGQTLPTMEGFPVHPSETYLQYERRVACTLTIAPSVAERKRTWTQHLNPRNVCNPHNQVNPRHPASGHATHATNTTHPTHATVLTEANLQNATDILKHHGFVILKGLLPESQTLPWGRAVLADFESAMERLKCHPVRPVDLMNPQTPQTDECDERNGVVFEPLSYKEMAMREDLRVDLRSGPEMEKLRSIDNTKALDSMKGTDGTDGTDGTLNGLNALNHGPTTIHADTIGSTNSWRFHPSILAILKAVFNPKEEEEESHDRSRLPLFKGNFGRWNFSGTGPDGSAQPFRIGQIGSVISCPGAGDQAIHSDTPHLYEHLDCLPCHYANVFTPGYKISKISHPPANDAGNADNKENADNTENVDNPLFQHEFDHDGIWTGNSTMGGTALVYGSHKLSASAILVSEEDCIGRIGDCSVNARVVVDGKETHRDISLSRRQILQLRTIRPALDVGDVVIFDNRVLHYGLANTSQRSGSGGLGLDGNAGRRPMLYLNVTQSWFHDPKNWDDQESIWGS